MPTENTLVTIAFSHYCEKARWALDLAAIPYREDGHLPLIHLAFTRPRGGRSTPLMVLTDGTVLKDSTTILDWIDDALIAGGASGAYGPSPIWPTEPEAAATARTVEAQLDDRFGPHARRLGYWHLLGAPPQLLFDFAKVAPRAEQMLLRVFRPLVVAFIKRSLKIDAAGAQRSERIVRETFAAMSDRLATGTGYLVGDRFSAVDLTFASLAAPLIFPDHHPIPWPPLSQIPPAMRTLVEALRATPAGHHVQRMYAEHRPPHPLV